MPQLTHPPLTAQQVRALHPGPTPIDLRDGLSRGLILTVLPSGRKQWAVRYVHHGKHRRLVLGDFPTLSIAKARRMADRTRTTIRDGQDPVGTIKAAKAKRTDTVKALVEAYLDEHARPHKRSADEDERMLDADVLPVWADRSVRSITRADVKALLKTIMKRGSPVAANRMLALVRKLLNFAVDDERIEANPAARIPKPAVEVSRDRVLTDDELRRIWLVLSTFPTTDEKPAPGRKSVKGTPERPLCPVGPTLAGMLKVRLLTAQRGGEVARMKWADVDLKSGWWTISGADTKNGEPHRVYLVNEARDLIRAELDEDDKPEGEDDEPESDFVFMARSGGAMLDRLKKTSALLVKATGISFRGHDFRRTAATKMAEAGIPREHISYVLNHVQGGARATKVYDRYSRDKEKQIAIETWGRVLTRILSEDSTLATVVPITKGA